MKLDNESIINAICVFLYTAQKHVIKYQLKKNINIVNIKKNTIFFLILFFMFEKELLFIFLDFFIW